MAGNVVSLIALIPMLLHSIWGCCWHHDHSLVQQANGAAAVTAPDGLPSVDDLLSHGNCPCHSLPGSERGHDPRLPAGHGGDERSHDEGPHDAPCGEEERCANGGAVVAPASQSVSLERGECLPLMVAALTVVASAALARCGELSRWSPTYSAQACRARLQVWLI